MRAHTHPNTSRTQITRTYTPLVYPSCTPRATALGVIHSEPALLVVHSARRELNRLRAHQSYHAADPSAGMPIDAADAVIASPEELSQLKENMDVLADRLAVLLVCGPNRRLGSAAVEEAKANDFSLS